MATPAAPAGGSDKKEGTPIPDLGALSLGAGGSAAKPNWADAKDDDAPAAAAAPAAANGGAAPAAAAPAAASTDASSVAAATAAAAAAATEAAERAAYGLMTISDEQLEQIVVSQADPTSPLYAVKRFEELQLAEDVLRGVYALQFKAPSKVQETALPFIFSGQNLIAQSQNGTGKTAAFVLGILQRVDRARAAPQGLVVCPTRELARQILDVVRGIGQFTPITSENVIKEGFDRNTKFTQHVLVGTPGSLLHALKNRSFATDQLKVFVVDEADQLMDASDSSEISRLRKALPKSCQVCLFSATYPTRVEKFADTIVPGANKMLLPSKNLTVKTIRQYFMRCPDNAGSTGTFNKAKAMALADLYGLLPVGQSMVFVNRRDTADELTRVMRAEGHMVSCIRGGDMPAKERDQVIDEFRRGKNKVLISTDLLARGIDVLHVTLVINFDLPYEPNRSDVRPAFATYLHRIGRTGRFGKNGVAISMVSGADELKCVQLIAQHFDATIAPLDAPSPDNMDVLEQALGGK